MTVVVDCNIWVMAISSRSAYHTLMGHLVNKRFSVLVSNEILLEYEEILSQKYDHETCLRFLIYMYEADNIHFKEIHFNWNLIAADTDDNKYCDCYVAGAADYLVTQDKHFQVLANIQFPAIKVISIDEFLGLLDQS